MLNGTNQWLAARRWRIYAALVLLAVLPLLLFLYSADRFLRKYTNDSLTRQSHVAGDAVARILLEYLASGEAFLSSVAAEPGFNVAAGRGDTKAMSGSLGQACRLQPDFTYCAVYDAQGRLLVAYPAGVRADAATPVWFPAFARSQRAQISGVHPSPLGKGEPVLAAVVPIFDAHGRPLGALAGYYRLSAIQGWLKRWTPSGTRWITVVDQHRQAVAEPGDAARVRPDVKDFPAVARALAGNRGSAFYDRGGVRSLVVHQPIPALHWAVLIQLPVDEVNQALWKFEKPLALAALAFIGLAALFGYAGAFLYRKLRKSELRLRLDLMARSERRYRQLFDTNPQPMWVYDLESLKFLDVNEAAIHAYGYTRDEFRAMTIKDIRPPEDVPELLHSIASSEGQNQLDRVGVWRHRKKDGSLIAVEIRQHRIEIDGRPAGLILATDISEKKLLEERLRLAERMEAVGRLAGGVAHDFNNLLGVIIGYSDLLLEQVPAGHALRRRVEEIKAAGDRAAALTRQLLAFSRKQVLEPKVLDLNGVVGSMSSMLLRLIGENIELVTVLDPRAAKVKADPSQLEQVIMNLAVNARDAMPRGGKLTLETQTVVIGENDGRHIVQMPPGRYTMLAVSDTGIGMDAETRKRIFEPFFTTKEKDKGTGLGLATVYGIVKQSNGYIWVYSEVGKGTTFKVYLPAETVEEPVVEAPPAPPPIPTGSETILLVEDAASLRELSRELLEAMGYSVLEAAHGAEALRVAEEHAGQINLLMTDMIMPGITGRELADQLRASQRGLKVLFISGYTENAVAQHEELSPDAGFLQKPFSRESLARKLREVLKKPDAVSHEA